MRISLCSLKQLGGLLGHDQQRAGLRAARRVDQLGGDLAAVTQEIQARDHRDRTRAEAPLLQAPDAIYLDSSNLSSDEVVEAILQIVRARTSNGKAVTS